MAYEPTVWESGDVVTSAKLNKLEQGVASCGGALAVHFNIDTGALDKTWQEINDALEAGGVYIVVPFGSDEMKGIGYVTFVAAEDNEYSVSAVTIDNKTINPVTFVASSSSGYPVRQG